MPSTRKNIAGEVVLERQAVVSESHGAGGAHVELDEDAESAQIKRVDELFADHGMPGPDDFVGPDSGKYFFDYGPPVVLADSEWKRGGPSEHELQLWSELSQLASAR